MSKDTGIVNIHGKAYETVASRVQKFREKYKSEDGWSIVTEVVERTEKDVVMKASILNADVVIATGFAEEQRNSSNINKTSALENCETSAIGRALAAFGMAGTEYASADEVANAINQQKAPKQPWKPSADKQASSAQREQVANLLRQKGIAKEDMVDYLASEFGVIGMMTEEEAVHVIEYCKAEYKELQPA